MSATVEYMRAVTERYRSLGYEPYRWFKADSPPPWQPLAKPLASARIGLLSTAGAYALGQVAYHYKDDSSIRAIPASTSDGELRFSHVTENYLEDARRDPACVLPLAGMRALAAEGAIGALPEAVFSCMGGIYSQRRVRDELAPALLVAYQAQQVDAVLLVPMCPVCHQSACIVARHLEANGISTMCLASALDIIESGLPPRATFVDYPLGHTAGKPFDRADQREILLHALRGLESMTRPGEIRMLANLWAAADDWKAEAGRTRGADTRRPRDETPQFQHAADREAARASGALRA
jgi:D-proline reductase (dithiol) PrdB